MGRKRRVVKGKAFKKTRVTREAPPDPVSQIYARSLLHPPPNGPPPSGSIQPAVPDLASSSSDSPLQKPCVQCSKLFPEQDFYDEDFSMWTCKSCAEALLTAKGFSSAEPSTVLGKSLADETSEKVSEILRNYRELFKKLRSIMDDKPYKDRPGDKSVENSTTLSESDASQLESDASQVGWHHSLIIVPKKQTTDLTKNNPVLKDVQKDVERKRTRREFIHDRMADIEALHTYEKLLCNEFLRAIHTGQLFENVSEDEPTTKGVITNDMLTHLRSLQVKIDGTFVEKAKRYVSIRTGLDDWGTEDDDIVVARIVQGRSFWVAPKEDPDKFSWCGLHRVPVKAYEQAPNNGKQEKS